MVDFNHIEMSGHLVRDTEITRTKSGKMITLFSIATNDDYKKDEQWQDRCYFFNVMYLGEKKLEKGTPIVIEGKLVQVTPKEKKEGMPSSYIKIQASKIIAYPKKVATPKAEVVEDFIPSTEEIPF